MNEVKKMKIRYLPHLDQLKGLAILLMVMGHVIGWSYPNYLFMTERMNTMSPAIFNASIVWRIIYSFHMPLLFFVSGYLFFFQKNKNWSAMIVVETLKKRTLRLLIPYLTTGVFVLFLKGYWGYWFLIVLFVLNVVVVCELYILEKIKYGLSKEVVAHSIMFVILYLCAKLYKDILPESFSNLAGLSNYYAIFCLGYMMHKYSNFEKCILRPTVSLGCFVAYICLIIVIYYYGYLSYFSFIIPIPVIIFLYNLFYFCNLKGNKGNGNNGNKYFSGVLRRIGESSMEIYIFHLFFVVPFKEVGFYILNITSFPESVTIQLAYSLIMSAIAIFFSLIASKIVKSNLILSQLLLGK